MTGDDATYTLDNTWEKAHQRLTLLQGVYDPGTISNLEAIGVGPGWRCLEVAAGAGSIARWLCDRVGDPGSVTAVDMDPRFLEIDPPAGLEIVRRDVVADGLPGDGYDLVHARALLMHLARPADLIAEMAARLRPGGVLLVEEADFYPITSTASGLYLELFEASCAVAAEMGGNWNWARHLPAAVSAAGLTAVTADVYSPMFAGGDTLWAKLVEMTWEQLMPLLASAGVAPELIAKGTAEVYDTSRWFPGPAMVSVSGRRPG
ncbi:MAG TPA: methyltransferase domain-containing protein [Acidimicrobiia bacterium]|nr:methyltransferase domain-containing protein [Acidimicrobiia bacterium]